MDFLLFWRQQSLEPGQLVSDAAAECVRETETPRNDTLRHIRGCTQNVWPVNTTSYAAVIKKIMHLKLFWSILDHAFSSVGGYTKNKRQQFWYQLLKEEQKMVMYVVYGPLRTVKVLRLQGVPHLSQHFLPPSWAWSKVLRIILSNTCTAPATHYQHTQGIRRRWHVAGGSLHSDWGSGVGERRHNRGISAIMQPLDKMPFPFHASWIHISILFLPSQ